MRKLIYSLVFVLVVGLTISTLGIVSAQQDSAQQGQGNANRQNRQGQQQRTQMDPEAMIKQMLDRIMEQLKPSDADSSVKLSDEESSVIKPMIEKIIRARMTQSQANRELVNSLRTVMTAKDIEATKKTEQIKAKLAEIKAKREDNKKKSEASEKELIELLTPEQEALLTVSGIINSDSSSFGGFGGPGGPGGNRGAGNQGNQGGNQPPPGPGQ